MTPQDKLIAALNRFESIRFPENEAIAGKLKEKIPGLKSSKTGAGTFWFEGDGPSAANTRVKVYPTGHLAFYSPEGNRFLMTDPGGHPLHEAAWATDPLTGRRVLSQVRMQLDSLQWVGIKPRARTFQTQIDISGQPDWQSLSLDDLRQKAAEAWRVPFSEVKYFYKDENLVHLGEGKYQVKLQKDALYALIDGTFDKPLFMSFMCALDWSRLDLIPVVELFQSALAGSGGAVFEFIWGLYEDQSREEALPPLRYRGLPTYPSKEALNIFSAFFVPKGPEGEDLVTVFMDPNRSHEITWTPRPNPPWRYFDLKKGLVMTVQEGNLFKVTVVDDPVPIPYKNCSRGGKPSCQREVEVGPNHFILLDCDDSREVPTNSDWNIAPQPYERIKRPKHLFTWKWFFNGFPPRADPVKMQYTLPFFPEDDSEIDESALQPMVLDQFFYYMEMSPAMPEKLEKVGKVLIHTLDMVISGCVDCTREREYTVLYGDPELAHRNAQLLWDYAASRNQLDNLRKVSFLPEREHVSEVYKEKYDLIFKWIPMMFYQDRENCQNILQHVVDALAPGGLLFLAGPRPMQGFFAYFGLGCFYSDPVVNMPFYRQHLKMCPENRVNSDLTVFLLEKQDPEEIRRREEEAKKKASGEPQIQVRGFERPQ